MGYLDTNVVLTLSGFYDDDDDDNDDDDDGSGNNGNSNSGVDNNNNEHTLINISNVIKSPPCRWLVPTTIIFNSTFLSLHLNKIFMQGSIIGLFTFFCFLRVNFETCIGGTECLFSKSLVITLRFISCKKQNQNFNVTVKMISERALFKDYKYIECNCLT